MKNMFSCNGYCYDHQRQGCSQCAQVEDRYRDRRERIATACLAAMVTHGTQRTPGEAAAMAVQCADALMDRLDETKT